jgi:uncharacterized protein
MALLIDGYNLLNVTNIFGGAGRGTELHRTRMALLNFLASSIGKRQRAETTIVFDAGGAPPGLPRSLAHDGITVHFAPRHSDADEMIEDLLEQWPAPRSLLVVSSDHRVQRAARHVGASFIDSEQWYAELLATVRQRRAAAADAKPAGEITADELNYWLGEFGENSVETSDLDNPFPPGYGDDVAEQDG